MDKLRAISYFNLAASKGSFAAAARAQGVSAAAVTQAIQALERALGTALFHRTSSGVRLTHDGHRYYAVSEAMTASLREVEQRLGTRGAKLRGNLTVVMFNSLGQNCVMPRIGRFLARFPEVEMSVKPVASFEQLANAEFEVAVMTGWPPERDFIVRPLAQSRNVICASPDYWMRRGIPQRPEELAEHDCLVFRSVGGAILDRWTFQKDGEQRSVNVSTRLLSENSAWVDEAACAGAGVVRRADLSMGRYLSAGMLVPALTDWEALDAPSHFALYRRAQRYSPLVRAFLDFLSEIYSELEAERVLLHAPAPRVAPRPAWFGHALGRQSVYEARRRTSTSPSRRGRS